MTHERKIHTPCLTVFYKRFSRRALLLCVCVKRYHLLSQKEILYPLNVANTQLVCISHSDGWWKLTSCPSIFHYFYGFGQGYSSLGKWNIQSTIYIYVTFVCCSFIDSLYSHHRFNVQDDKSCDFRLDEFGRTSSDNIYNFPIGRIDSSESRFLGFPDPLGFHSRKSNVVSPVYFWIKLLLFSSLF